ncbi:ABC transporter substrate-binding protein [Porticoccaceae bacterium]|nr:ABC transporter substrate-binding protein [Porticoccaceae bacterium]
MHNTNWFKKCLFGAVLCPMAGASSAEQQTPIQKLVQQQFASLFEDISVQLATDKQRYLADPMAYQVFIDLRLRPLWDISFTTRALLGRHNFSAISPLQQQAIIDAVGETLVRYAFEGLEKYSGQQFRIVDVVINQRAAMGWVQVLMESTLIPDIVLDVLIKQADHEKDVWQAVDIRFKGITYVAVKKHSFRETIEGQGIETLITDLERKNREYYASICTKTQSSGRAPCIPVVK